MKPFLVLGKSGQLGRLMQEELTALRLPFIAYSSEEVDLKSADFRLPVGGSQGVINCAAYTQVDAAESNEAVATAINGASVGKLALLCQEANVPLLHFSTDYVFDGRSSVPYRTDHPHAPINAYGRSKAEGERLLKTSGAEHLLIRTSWVYSEYGSNFLLTMAKLLRERDSLKVVNDQRGRPTYARELASRSLALLRSGVRGVHHLADEGEVSWYEFAQAIRETLDARAVVSPCATAEFPRPAPRPAYSVLATEEADRLIGPASPFQENIKRALIQANEI